MTLTPEQIAQFRAEAGLSLTPPTKSNVPTADSILEKRKTALGLAVQTPTKPEVKYEGNERVKEAVRKRGEAVYGAITGTSPESQGESPLVRGVQATGEAFGGITDVVSEVGKSAYEKLVPEKVKEGISTVVQKASESPVGEMFGKANEELGLRLAEIEKTNPEFISNLESALKIAKGGGDIAGGILAAEGVKQTLEKTPVVMESAADKVSKLKDKVSGIAQDSDNITFNKNIEETQKILNPTGKYTPTEVEKLRSKGEIKVTGYGPLKKEVASPKPNLQNETLAQLVKEGKISAKKLPSENTKIIKEEARKLDMDIDELVNRPELNKPFNKKTINKVFESVENSAKDDLVFVPDTTEAKAYKTVIDVAREELNKNSFNNSGLRKSIKNFNARMEQILGKNIYGEGSESVANARIQAAKDTRSALNTFLAENLESPLVNQKGLYTTKGVARVLPSKSQYESGRTMGGGLYKDILKKEAQLLNSADEISYRSRGTLNKSELKQYLDANPKLKYTLEAAGLGLLGKEILD